MKTSKILSKEIINILYVLIFSFPVFSYSTSLFSQYDLQIKIIPGSHRIEISGKWELPPADTSRKYIDFYLSPKMFDLEMQLIEPQKSVSITSLTGADIGGDMKWTAVFKDPVPAGESVKFQFSYRSDTSAAPQMNISPEGSFAGSGGELWYPQLSFSIKETGSLNFLVPENETVISNGILVSTSEQALKGNFIFRVTNPSKFGFACGRYNVIQRPGSVPFALYLLDSTVHADSILSGCSKALDFLITLFGPFPYPNFSFVEVDFRSAVLGTGEYGFILADKSQFEKGFNLAYWSHEIGHQWWGNLVKSSSGYPGQMMLSEGIAQFGALLAIESIEGEKSAAVFRRTGYKGYNINQSAEGYFNLVKDSLDMPLSKYIPKSGDEILTMHRLANSKGFIVLDMLSRYIGREKFASILKEFIQKYSNQSVTWDEFQKEVENYYGSEINWFWEQWLERTGAPGFDLKWSQNGSELLVTIIQQTLPLYRANIEIEIDGPGSRLLKECGVSGYQNSFSWEIPFKADSVVLDPKYKVLRWIKDFPGQEVK